MGVAAESADCLNAILRGLVDDAAVKVITRGRMLREGARLDQRRVTRLGRVAHVVIAPLAALNHVAGGLVESRAIAPMADFLGSKPAAQVRLTNLVRRGLAESII